MIRTKSNSFKFLLAISYITFVFNVSYNFGRHLGSFIISRGILNRFLILKDGESILGMQTKLFIKCCLLDELREKEGKKVRTTWKNSFIMDQIFGSSLAKAKKYLRYIPFLSNSNNASLKQ